MSHGGAYFQENITELEKRDPALADRVRGVAASGELRSAVSRQGSAIALLELGDKSRPLHSRFDPIKEGERLAGQFTHEGFLVFLGIGAGHQIRPFLRSRDVSELLLVEQSVSHLRSIIEAFPVADLLRDPRVRILAGADRDTAARAIRTRYLPLVSGALRVIPLSAYTAQRPDYFDAIARTVDTVAREQYEDYAVQSRFGRQWTRNALLNMRVLPGAHPYAMPETRAEALVLGAGPSLSAYIDEIRTRRSSALVISSDAALPVLHHNGIEPDCVLSIDAQAVSALHILASRPQRELLLSELSSPPVLSRAARQYRFVSGGHPLVRVLNRELDAVPEIDTGGGNVTHAAVSLAVNLGATTITLYGADFAYPASQPYARGSYLFDSFASEEDRLATQDTRWTTFLVGRAAPKPGAAGGAGGARPAGRGSGVLYRSRALEAHRDRLYRFAEDWGVSLVNRRFFGTDRVAPTGRPDSASGGDSAVVRSLGKTVSRDQVRAALAIYQDALGELRLPEDESVPVALAREEERRREAWYSLLPLAAFYAARRTGRDEGAEHDSWQETARRSLEAARAYTLALVQSLREDDI